MFVDYNYSYSYYTGKYGVTENNYIHIHVVAIFPNQRN